MCAQKNLCNFLQLVYWISNGELVCVEPFTKLQEVLNLLPTITILRENSVLQLGSQTTEYL